VTSRAGGLVLELDRTFDAPREQVFRSLTEPSGLAAWWGPRGFTTPEIDLDLRVGGAFRFGMQPPDGALFHLAGEFREIVRPARLVYTFRWEEPDEDDVETVVRLLLDAVDDGTALTPPAGGSSPPRHGWPCTATGGRIPSTGCGPSSRRPGPAPPDAPRSRGAAAPR
jgi:uncharacterized protein YndB with AHSA1/START domain